MLTELDVNRLLTLITLFLLVGEMVLFYLVIRAYGKIRSLSKRIDEWDPNAWEASEQELSFYRKRAKFRASTELLGELLIQGEKIEAQIVNISRTGILLSLKSSAVHMDETYPIKITLEANDVILADVRVVRILEKENQIGCSFQNISMEDVRRISNFVSKQASMSLSEIPNR